MNKYFLEQNLLFNCTHVKKVRWYHRLFGMPRLTIDTCEAVSVDSAKSKFKLKGYTVGLGF